MSAALAAPLHERREAPAARGLDALFVLNNLSVGGSERKTVRVANALQERGGHIGIAYLNAPDTLRSEVQASIPVWCLHRTGKYSFAATTRLREILRRERVATVVSVNSYPALYVAAATRRLPEPPRTVALMNTTAYRSGERWRRGLYRRVLGFMDCTVYGCEVQRGIWLPRGDRLWQRSRVIYNGVEPERFAAITGPGGECRERFDIPGRRFVFGTVGRLVAEKNQGVLIDALAKLRERGVDAHLIVVGDGPERDALIRRAALHDVAPWITFTGALSDVRPALAAMEVFVLPSLAETFSNAALEAMAMALPVVLTPTGGASEMVGEAEGIILGGADLVDAIVRALHALHADAERRRRMGAAARERVRSVFSWHAMIDAYAALLLDRRGMVHG